VDDHEQLSVAGLTGIDLAFPIAGPGSRSYAFIIDWHIRTLLAVAWLLSGWLLLRLFWHHDARFFKGGPALLIGWPAALIYLLYHPLLELLMHGRTPGKRMAGVRLVTQRGGQPAAGAILIRNVFRLIDSLPGLYVVGLISCMVTAQRVRIGDMAAGTVLVLDRSASADALARMPSLVAASGLDPRVIELATELLERWPSLSVERRAALARTLLARINPAWSIDSLATVPDAELRQRLRDLLPAAA
jgi:uncharacterized RDD family membrane protein YckC